MRVVVFAGPTIAADEVVQILGADSHLEADCRGPVSQGEVYRAALERPAAIGIIDGYFELQPSVWHKEILWAMSEGIHVYGSASMGALRAAELASFGMVGVGMVFESFRDGILEDDDEVAVVHGNEESGYRTGSDAMVNIRATLRKAADEGIISAGQATEAVHFAKSLYYSERCYAALIEHLGEMDAFGAWLTQNAVNQKYLDAVRMLEALRAFLADSPGQMRVDFVFQETLWWEMMRQFEGGRELGPADCGVLSALEQLPGGLERARMGALGLYLGEQTAVRKHLPLLASDIAAQASAFCKRLAIGDSADLERWLRDNHCDQREMDRIFEIATMAALNTANAGTELNTYILRYLRWIGDYVELLERSAESTR